MKIRPGLQSFLNELRRRRVSSIAVLYLVGGYAVLQFADTILVSSFGMPDWIMMLLVIAGAAGFPLALVIAWVVKLTPEGLQPDQGMRFAELVTGVGRFVLVGVVALVSLGMGVAGWQLWGAGTAEAQRGDEPLDPRRLAVLYLDDHSPDSDLGYLADALTEALIHELSQASGLTIISRHGVKPYRSRGRNAPDADLREIASALEVGSIVEGSVTPSGAGVRVTFQLIDARDLSHLHSGTLDAAAGAWVALQDSLVTQVARALRRELGAAVELERLRLGTQSDEAWALVSRAARLRADYTDLRISDTDAGLQLLSAADSLLAVAERLDPSWLEPILLRGSIARRRALSSGPVAGTTDSVLGQRALDHAERAVAMAPRDELPRALSLRGLLRLEAARGASGEQRARLIEGAESDLRQAVGEDPNRAEAWQTLSELLVEQSRFEEARLAAEHALEADEFLELQDDALWALAYSALQFGPDPVVVDYCDEGRRRFPDKADFVVCRLFILASFPQVEPDLDAAWRLADSLAAIVGAAQRSSFRAYGQVQVAKVAARAGLADSARAIIRRARGPETPVWLTYDEAHANLLLRDTARTIQLLDVALANEVVDSAVLAREWWFQPLHQEPRFRRLLGRHAPSAPSAPGDGDGVGGRRP